MPYIERGYERDNRDEIDRLRADLAAVTDDYLRVHKDKMDYFEEIARLRGVLQTIADCPKNVVPWSFAKDALAPRPPEEAE